MNRFFLLFVCFLIVINAHSNSVKGSVIDAKSGEALVGAIVYIKGNTKLKTITGLDGSFVLRGINDSLPTICCNCITYKSVENKISVPANGIRNYKILLSAAELELAGVEVVASNLLSDRGVRNMEQMSTQVVNIVSARSMELSPDLTVAGVLQRVSGVTIEQNSTGVGQYAIVRGMDKRYNITLVNGVKISSPDNKQRFVPLNIFPSELLDRLEVSKTRNAEVEGDATGGAVNLVMKNAPNQLSINANISTGYNEYFLNHNFSSFNPKNIIPTAPYEQYGSEYRATMNDFGNAVNAVNSNKAMPNVIGGLSIGNRLFDKRFGFIVAGNYNFTNRATKSTFFEDEMLQTQSTVRITSMKERDYSEQQSQYGLHSKLDFKVDKNNKLELYSAYINLSDQQVRQSNGTNFKLFYEPEKGNGDFSYQTRLRQTNQQVLSSTLQGEHFLYNALNIDWSLIYSDARKQVPDETSINLDNLRQLYVDKIYADADGSTRRWNHNSDMDYSGIIHLKYKTDFSFGKITWQAGALYRDKKRDNSSISYTLKPVDNQLYGTTFNGFDEIKWTLYTPYGSVGPLNYKASEKITAGYCQSKINISKIEFIAGLRAENTNQGYFMFFPKAGDEPTGEQLYTDFLPNSTVKYSYSDIGNLRASYYRSINRPGFFEIVPYQMIYEEYTEYGNKNLKHAVIENFDVRWELFPKPEEEFLLGVFYKNIKSPIEYAYYSVNQRQFGLGPANLGDAKNMGIEMDYIKYIGLFGIKTNYTYTNSAITTTKVFYEKDESGNTKTTIVNQVRPLVGQAEHVANFSLLYKDVKHGWNAQLACVYLGDRINIASRYLNSDYWQKGNFQMDFSADKKFKNGWSVFFKANNLLNTPLIEMIKTNNEYNNKFPLQSATSNETLIRKDFFNRTFLLGIRYKL